MAFSSSSRNSLDSGVGMSRAVEGIKMKISPQFLPPPKVTLPSHYEAGNPTEILFMEYDYELEHKVLAWCTEEKLRQEAAKRASDEAEAELAKQQAEQQAMLAESSAADEAVKETELDTSGESDGRAYSDDQVAFPFPSDVDIASDSVAVNNYAAENRVSPCEVQAEVCDVTKESTLNDTTILQHGISSGVQSQPMPKPMAPSVDSQGILVPTRIAAGTGEAKSAEVNNQVTFDLADFEQEQDPFDKFELKTLNDMAELNKVLQGAHPATSVSQSTPAFPQTSSQNFSGVQQPPPPTSAATIGPQTQTQTYAPVRRSDQYENIFPGNGSNAISSNQALAPAPRTNHRPMPTPRKTVLKNVEYPDMGSMPVSSANSVANDQFELSFLTNGGVKYSAENTAPSQSANMNASNNTGAGYQVAAQAYAPSASAAAVKYNHSSYPNIDNFYATDFSAKLQTSEASARTRAAAPYGRSKTPDYQFQAGDNIVINDGTANGQTNVTGMPVKSNGTMSGLRPARSVPDLTSAGEFGETRFPKSHTPPPTSQRTDPAPPQHAEGILTNHTQSWQHYWQSNSYQKPEVAASGKSHPIPSSSSNVALTVAPRPTLHPPPKSDLPDPYHEMQPQTQQFVDNIADMGFPRSRVARAVSKLGEDYKQVIDHLVLVDRLTEKGASGDDAETALKAFEEDQEKAELYLQLIGQFRELGFAEHRIKEVLVTCKLDENAALDQLTAVS